MQMNEEWVNRAWIMVMVTCLSIESPLLLCSSDWWLCEAKQPIPLSQWNFLVPFLLQERNRLPDPLCISGELVFTFTNLLLIILCDFCYCKWISQDKWSFHSYQMVFQYKALNNGLSRRFTRIIRFPPQTILVNLMFYVLPDLQMRQMTQ